MKQILPSTAIAIVLVLSNKASAQQAYQPGAVLRVDFEGRHKIENRVLHDSVAYHSGSVLRIDFEGMHSVINHQLPSRPIYNSGPVLRVDFEGRHRKTNHQ